MTKIPLKPWKVLSTRRDKSYRVFSLRTDRALSPRTGQAYDFFILESSPWVNIIPLSPQKEVVLIRQYRHGTRDVTLEIPGGLVEEGDSPEEAAERELFEETGFRATEIIPLGFVHPNPAIQNNRCYTFIAKDVFPAGEQSLDEKEDIEVLCRPVTEIPRLIKDGEITHALVLAAFYRFFVEYRPELLGLRSQKFF
ncbi:MAG: NUDIX hydrolase [Deltaproteobacteria bacterium]|nr:NUDIX hydrolase [Deltaproteobacteria bacterium]